MDGSVMVGKRQALGTCPDCGADNVALYKVDKNGYCLGVYYRAMVNNDVVGSCPIVQVAPFRASKAVCSHCVRG